MQEKGGFLCTLDPMDPYEASFLAMRRAIVGRAHGILLHSFERIKALVLLLYRES